MSVTISPHATVAARQFNQTASVYTAHATTGQFTVLAISGLACQLAHVDQSSGTGAARAELAATRRLYWSASYALPSEYCQIEVEGVRWNIVSGTVTEQRDRQGLVAYRRADVTRAADG